MFITIGGCDVKNNTLLIVHAELSDYVCKHCMHYSSKVTMDAGGIGVE